MKLSENALDYLVGENDNSLLYYSNQKREKNSDIRQGYLERQFEMHKEIEAFLEEVEIKEDEK